MSVRLFLFTPVNAGIRGGKMEKWPVYSPED
jgi:hypothetical protein